MMLEEGIKLHRFAVALGSQPDLPPFDCDVRFAALNGLKSDIAPCPKSATSRHQFDFDGEDSRTL